MAIDYSIVKRGFTIATVAPVVLYFVLNSVYAVAFLVWALTFLAMIEWTLLKRHLKVALLSSVLEDDRRRERQNAAALASAKEDDAGEEAIVLPPFPQKEFPYPVAKTNTFIVVKCFLCSLITWIAPFNSPTLFLMGMTTYFFFWTIMTLTFQNSAEVSAVIAQRKMRSRRNSGADLSQQQQDAAERPDTPPPTSITRRSNVLCDWENKPADAFALYEMDIMANKPITDVFLSFSLEYFGFVWISGLSYSVLLAASGQRGHIAGVIILVANWANDIAALIVGKSMKGKTRPLYPRISPNKSLEGAVAGIIANGVVGGLLLWVWPGAPYLDWPFDSMIHPCLLFTLLGFVFGVLGVVGDLLQSLFKRTARIKDSGRLLPGHGGILDRIDGMLLTYPPGYWMLWTFLLYY